jgi:hypothetical protein
MKNDLRIIVFHALINPGRIKTQKLSSKRKFFIRIYSGMIPPEKYMVAITRLKIAVFPLKRDLLSGYARQIVKNIFKTVPTIVRNEVKATDLSTLPFLIIEA